MWHPADQLAKEVGEPFLYTFTAKLPFLLEIPDTLGHTIRLHTEYADTADRDRYGSGAEVDIRVFGFEEDGQPMWPPGINEALDHSSVTSLMPTRRSGMAREISHPECSG